MIYEEEAPAPAAAQSLLGSWRFALEPDDPAEIEHIVPPDGLISAVGVRVGGHIVHVSLLGPHAIARPVQARQGAEVRGLRFRPGLARAWLGLEPVGLRDRIAGPEELPPPLTAWLRALFTDPAAAEGMLAGRPPYPARADPDIGRAAEALLAGVDAPSIAALAQDAGLSPRQFHRRFTAAIGLPPKLFAQVRRQRAAWMAAVLGEAAGLSAASAAAGFADQAHFARAVRATFDATPREVGRRLGAIRHSFPRG